MHGSKLFYCEENDKNPATTISFVGFSSHRLCDRQDSVQMTSSHRIWHCPSIRQRVKSTMYATQVEPVEHQFKFNLE